MEVSVNGRFAPVRLKPVPTTVAALTVTKADPVEVRVSDCVAGEFRVTSPNATLVALMLSAGVAEPSDKVKLCELLVVDAVNVAVCAVLTAVAVAVKLPLVDPPAICTEGETVTAELLLARLTLIPPDGALALTVTVHASVAAPVSELVEQFNEDTDGRIAIVPLPLSPTGSVPPLMAFDVKRRVPDSAAFVVGANCTVT